MALPPLTQPTFLGDRDPMIRDPFNTQPIEPGYIRDSDLGSAFVRYPAAGGRLIEKGIGALMDDPLGLVTGAARGAYDFVRESGDPATFAQNLGMSLGLPIVESGQRLAGGDYGGMSLEEEEEARILDALTVAELIPMVGLGIKGVTGAMRRRLRAENPGMTDPEIEAMVAQMELEATRPDPGGVDLGPRPAELSLDELPETPLAELQDIRDLDETIDVDEAPVQAAELAVFDAELARLEADQANDFGFGDDEYDPVIAGDDDYDPMAGTALRDYESAVEDRLNLELGRYFGDNDMMTTSDALVGIGEDVVAALDDLGYGAAETVNFIDDAMVRAGYNTGQRQQLMDELFPPVATEPGQPLDPWRNVADADDIEPVVVRDPYTGDFEELSPNNPYAEGIEDTTDVVQAIQWERENAPMDEAEFLEAQATGALQIPEGGAPPGLQALANAVQENMLADDPFGPEPVVMPTPMNQLEAMDFSLTGNDTKLNSRFEEVVLAPGAPKKFANKEEFINFLTNQKNGVTNAEIEARGIDRLSDGPIDLDDPDVRRWVFRDPLKVRILDGADVQYKGYFLRNPTDYRETIITLDGSPFDANMAGSGVIGDSQHFGATQYSMGGPSLVHMRTGQFEVLDPPTKEKPATVAGKTFHVGEIQSQATQDARKYRQARKTLTQFEDLGGLDRVVEDMKFGGKFEEINEIESLRKRIDRMKGTDPEKAANLETFLQLDLEKLGFDSEADAIAYRDAFVERMRELDDDPTHRYSTARNSLNSLIGLATDVNVDDLGVGSLYQTDRITNIAVKQALEQAIDSGADFITFNRGDLVHGMTGGKLEGHQEYYDRILPKNVNKLLAKLEKQHKVKLPRLEDLRLKTESGPELGLVKGFALTPELKELFKGTGVSAFKEGGQVKLRSGVMALPGNGVVR